MSVRLRQKVGRAHEEEEPGVDGEQVAEMQFADGDDRADDRAEDRRCCVECEPPHRRADGAALLEDERHRVHAVGEVV